MIREFDAESSSHQTASSGSQSQQKALSPDVKTRRPPRGEPLIRLNGTVAPDQLDVRDTADAPIVTLKHSAPIRATAGTVFHTPSRLTDAFRASRDFSAARVACARDS